MTDTFSILVTGGGGIILAGAAYAVGYVRGRGGMTDEALDLHAKLATAESELTRLTDRDDHGRYVKAGEVQYAKWEPDITAEMADHIDGLRNKVVIGMNAQPRIESTKVARKPKVPAKASAKPRTKKAAK